MCPIFPSLFLFTAKYFVQSGRTLKQPNGIRPKKGILFMMTQNVNMYSPQPQLGTRKVFQIFPVPISKIPTLTVGLAATGATRYLHPENVPANSFSPPEFNFLKMLDVV